LRSWRRPPGATRSDHALRFGTGIIEHSEKLGIEPRRTAMLRCAARSRPDWGVSAGKDGGDDRERECEMSKRSFHAFSTPMRPMNEKRPEAVFRNRMAARSVNSRAIATPRHSQRAHPRQVHGNEDVIAGGETGPGY
jgi:hypothetical protein